MTASRNHAERFAGLGKPSPAPRDLAFAHASHIGLASLAMQMPARVQAPSRFFVIDGKSFAFLPVRQPSVERVDIYQTQARG